MLIIRFLQAKNMGAAEIHGELGGTVYGRNVMSEGTVTQWCRMFKDGGAHKCSRGRAKWSAFCSD
jgi:hypothetical protein